MLKQFYKNRSVYRLIIHLFENYDRAMRFYVCALLIILKLQWNNRLSNLHLIVYFSSIFNCSRFKNKFALDEVPEVYAWLRNQSMRYDVNIVLLNFIVNMNEQLSNFFNNVYFSLNQLKLKSRNIPYYHLPERFD